MKTYLIASSSYKMMDFELKKIIQDSLNVVKYDLRSNSLEEVINEANYFSLTNEEKFIVVKCGNLFKANKKEDDENSNKDTKLLEKYLDNPSELSSIIFVTNEMPDKRRKIFKKIEENAILLPALNKKDLVYKCMELLKNNGYKCNYETANFIVENSYVNYDIMTNELDKIYALIEPCELSISKLKDVISIALNDNVYSFISAIVNRDLELAIKTSQDFEVLKIDPSMILIMLAKDFQIYYMIKSGVNLKELQSLLKKEDWQMKAYLEKRDLYTLEELKKIIITLNDYDYKLKSGLLDKSVLLDLISLDLCE